MKTELPFTGRARRSARAAIGNGGHKNFPVAAASNKSGQAHSDFLSCFNPL
jgi:hypothetical protein